MVERRPCNPLTGVRLPHRAMSVGQYKDQERRRMKQKEYMRAYRNKLKEQGIKRKWNSKDYHKNIRLKAIDVLGGPKCINCGCDNLDILEINHIHGGGNLDAARRSNQLQFYRQVIKTSNPTSLYDVRCRPCNILHYIQDILGIMGHTIIWNRPLES